jgi:DNA-binding transcriptional ArsR family regulator
MTDHTAIPDYELADVLTLTTPEQFAAMAGSVRPKILALLSQRALSTKQVAELLGAPKGTAGHHLKVLEAAGLIRIVRTRQVRAVTEKYYGRVARVHRISTDEVQELGQRPDTQALGRTLLRQASTEMAAPPANDPSTVIVVRARLSPEQVRRFAHRLEALSQEFTAEDAPGERVYGFVGSVYLTDLPDTANLPSQDNE